MEGKQHSVGGDNISGATSMTTKFRARGMKGQKKEENVLQFLCEHALEFQDYMEVVTEKNPKIWPLEALRWCQGPFVIRYRNTGNSSLLLTSGWSGPKATHRVVKNGPLTPAVAHFRASVCLRNRPVYQLPQQQLSACHQYLHISFYNE